MNPLRHLRLMSLSVLSPIAFMLSGADMLILTPAQMEAEAQSLAELHRVMQGLVVDVVTDTDIAPVPEADAVKDYVRKCHADGLRYLLIIGEGYDPEHSDAWYGMLSEASTDAEEWFTMPDIAVGRIPAVNPSQLADYTAKVERYLTEATSRYSRDILIACDDGDKHEHLDRAERLAAEFPDATVHKAYVGLDRVVDGEAKITSRRLTDALQEGVDLMIYVGHGSATSVTGEGIWNVNTASAIRHSHHPWALFCSCAIGAFRNFETTLAEAMIYNRDGGAIGVIAATTAVYSSYNQEIALRFLRERNSAEATVFVGDLWLAVQRECIAAAKRTINISFGRNVIAYTFVGDPALPYYVPELQVECEMPVRVSPWDQFEVTGEIVSPDGLLYDGDASLAIYAPARKMPTIDDSGGGTRVVTCRSDILWRGKVPVRASRFSAPVTLPAVEPGDIRMAVHFLSDDGKEGSGVSGSASLTVASGKPVDSVPPAVTMYYEDGVIVAEVSDYGSGVNSGSCMLGASPSLIVDGGVRLPVVAESVDGNVVRLSAAASHLVPGTHEASVAVSDNAGNRVTERLSFVVSGDTPVIELLFPDEVARESVEFSWTHTMSGNVDVTLIVTNLLGDTVLYETIAGNDRYEWDLAGIASGIYLVRVLATDGKHHVSAHPRNLTIIR